MAQDTGNTYVGFGFGAIQAGLFLYEAARCGAFSRLVVAEMLPELVAAVRRAGDRFALNIAHRDRVETVEIGPLEILDPAAPADRERLVEAIASAGEIGTAVPGVGCYVSDGPGSLHRVLADGLRLKASRGAGPAVIYAAENDNYAAETLQANVFETLDEADRQLVRQRVRFLNTVIGKMSGLVVDPEQMRANHLRPVTPGQGRAFLVEAFNRILISKIRFDALPHQPAFRRGITVFEEKPDLLPFEEAKLYGHNATHALAAYVGAMIGARRIADLTAVPGMMDFLRAAFVDESGKALIAKHAGLDPLFTDQGYRCYADDLLERMTNPHLCDTVTRVGRHPERKLMWHDRLIGTMRMVLAQGVEPRRYAVGAAAALACLDASVLEDCCRARGLLETLWGDSAPVGPERDAVLDRVDDALQQVRSWQTHGWSAPDLGSCSV